MSITGAPDTAPYRVGYPVADTIGGMTAAFAIAAALADENRDEGTFIDVSMLEAVLATMGWAVSNYLIAGKEPQPLGNENVTASPSGTFQTGDGLINIAANKQEQFEALCLIVRPGRSVPRRGQEFQQTWTGKKGRAPGGREYPVPHKSPRSPRRCSLVARLKLLDAALMSAVDHGPQAPSIAIARMAATCGIGLNNAIASGVNALGDVHGGAGEQAVELYQTIAKRIEEGASLAALGAAT